MQYSLRLTLVALIYLWVCAGLFTQYSAAWGAEVPTAPNPSRDVHEVCAKYEQRKAYDENAKPVLITCEMADKQYRSIINYLKNNKQPVFAALGDMLKRVGERGFYEVFRKKDIEDCESTQALASAETKAGVKTQLRCVMGDMNFTFSLNEKNQILKTKCEFGVGARIYQNVYDQYFGKFKHVNPTLNYNLMVAEFFAKAAPLVDGEFVRTEFVNNNFIVTFVNPTFSP